MNIGTAGVIFTFDSSNRDSFNALDEWIEKTEHFIDVKGLVGVIAALKCDADRCVTDEEAKNYARMKKLTYFSTSAKTGSGIERLFLYVINQVVECSKDRLSVVNKDYELHKNSLVLKKTENKDKRFVQYKDNNNNNTSSKCC